MPQLHSTGGIRAAIFVRRELDAEIDGRPQFGGQRLAVQPNAAKQALQPQIEGRESVRGARLQPVDGAAAGGDDEEDSVFVGSRRFRGMADGKRV